MHSIVVALHGRKYPANYTSCWKRMCGWNMSCVASARNLLLTQQNYVSKHGPNNLYFIIFYNIKWAASTVCVASKVESRKIGVIAGSAYQSAWPVISQIKIARAIKRLNQIFPAPLAALGGSNPACCVKRGNAARIIIARISYACAYWRCIGESNDVEGHGTGRGNACVAKCVAKIYLRGRRSFINK